MRRCSPFPPSFYSILLRCWYSPFSDTCCKCQIWALACGRGQPSTIPPLSSLRPTVIAVRRATMRRRSEEHTSELQSRGHLVCRLLLEKKKKQERNKR